MKKQTKNTKKPFLLCPYCIQAIESRGERLKKLSPVYDADESGSRCNWCEEETEDLTECEFV